MMTSRVAAIATAMLVVTARAAFAQSEPADSAATGTAQAEELAKKLSNPVADLISVPFQNNYDWGLNPDHTGWQYKLNFQPVVPFHLSSDWNLISRTILPIIAQDNVALGSGSQTGLGDITQSFFFSPQKATGGIIWGVGPVVLVPTATDRLLGAGKWGLGPTAVALKQAGGLTVGVLANQIWSIAGPSDRREVSSTFLQPFLAYTTHAATTFSLNTESSYDWVTGQWTVPVNLTVAQLFRPSESGLPIPLQVQVGYRYYAARPEGGPTGGVRFSLIALLPR
jgi:hypothetical protein